MMFERSQRRDDPDAVRMTLGEHLEELRARVIRSLLALLLACLLCIWPAKYLLALLARPVVLVLQSHGQPDSFLATSPVEAILVYIKVVVFFGILIAAPYILHQLWSFVAAGLYRHEKRFVMRFVPLSFGLFIAGVVFMYLFVLIMSLNFLVGFGAWLPLPKAEPTAYERTLLNLPRVEVTDTQPADARPGAITSSQPAIELVERDPDAPAPGAVWINVLTGKLKIRGTDERTYAVQLKRDDRRALVTTHFRIGEYLSFLLIMTIAFGVAFQTPLVVLFLARSGIVPPEVFHRYHKIAILIIVFISGLLSSADLFSHIVLMITMILLFELGLFLVGRGAAPPPRAPEES